MPHDSVNSRANEGLDDLEGDDSLYNGSHTHGDFGRQETVRSPSQLPPLQEEPSSPSFEGNKPSLYILNKAETYYSHEAFKPFWELSFVLFVCLVFVN